MSTALLKTLARSCFRHITNRSEQIRLESRYKAALIREAVKDLSIEKRNRPDLKDNQVRIQVYYCSVNSGDLLSFEDETKDLPFTPGYEFSGEVIEVGKKITPEQIMKGEKVAALSLDRCGGFAEECVVSIEDVFRLPSNLHPKEAAVITSGHALAMFAFSKLSEIKKDEQVVISASTAGLGLAAVDVAANVYGAKVIGVVDSNERADLVRERGAFQTLQYGPKLHKQILEATNNKGVNVVYDAVGEHLLDNLGKCAVSGGKIFLAASNYKSIPPPPPNRSLTILSLLDLRHHNYELYRCVVSDALDLADQGIIAAHISAKFNFEDINKAIQHIQNKKATGKVVIKIIN